jgi:ubiquinone/menaquinone biosynthesis C-methylase UbiE
MSSYYTGKRAKRYNIEWKSYTETTLKHVLNAIDFTRLKTVSEQEGRAPRVFDVACGTGILLKRLLERIPTLEVYGVDGSEDMLAQAQEALSAYPHVHLKHIRVGATGCINLPFERSNFDLITMTNTLHDIERPENLLQELSQFLTANGQLVVEDYARRTSPFPWRLFERLIKRVEPEYVRSYTLIEAQQFFKDIGFLALYGDTFEVDLVFHAWVVQATHLSNLHLPDRS